MEAYWAEYKIIPYSKSYQDYKELFEKFKTDTEKILSMPEILITKKTKKKQDKIVDFKNSIGAYQFKDDALYIHLKVGQASEIPALRADDLMKLINADQIFEITRIHFLNEKLNII